MVDVSPLLMALLIAFLLGFAVGFGVRAYISARRRERAFYRRDMPTRWVRPAGDLPDLPQFLHHAPTSVPAAEADTVTSSPASSSANGTSTPADNSNEAR